jgi:cytochrome P450
MLEMQRRRLRKEKDMGQITLNDLLSQETKRHPWAFFGKLHAQGPLSYVIGDGMGFWITTTYEDAIAVLKDPRFINDRQRISLPQDEQEDGGVIASRYALVAWRRDMLMVDPPDHTRLRRLVSKAFTPRLIEQLRPHIQQIADELLDTVQTQGQMDLINDFAFLLPITVISDLLGIPEADRKSFRAWTQALVTITAGQQIASAAALKTLLEYITTLLSEKREHPDSDLTSGLVQAKEHGDALSEIELLSTMYLLIIGGYETMANLIGTGMLALLQHPDQMELLRGDLSLLPLAVEELLRYTTPLSLSSLRWASEDIPMHDKVIRKGDMVFVSLIAADTDRQQFPDPELLDIMRQENPHLAFGKGVHSCLGAPLARLEGQIAIGTLLKRLPHLRLACAPEHLVWNRTLLFRGLISLPVTF